MKIAICIKQVPDTTDIQWTEHNTIKRDGVESILNPYDVYAIEAGLKIKHQTDAELSVFTMGPAQAQDILRKALAVGADKAYLISDRKFAAADTYATGSTIAAAIKKALPDFDIIICGQFAIDGDTAQTGPTIANMLDIPQVTYVKDIESVNEDIVTVTREVEDGIEKLTAELPVLLCVLKKDEDPTRAKINGIINARNAEIQTLTLDDIGLPPERAGLKGSPTYVSKAFRPVAKHRNLPPTEASPESQVLFLYNKLQELGAFDNE